MNKICDNIGSLVKSIRVVKLPVENEKEDVTDYFENYNGTADDLKKIVAATDFDRNKVLDRLQEEKHKESEELKTNKLRDYLHTNSMHNKIIPKRFCEEMLKSWDIAFSKIGNQRKFFIYRDGFGKIYQQIF